MLRGAILFALHLGVAPMAFGATSLEAEYGAAQEAFERRDYAKAAAGFEQLLQRLDMSAEAGSGTAALLRARLGAARFALGDTVAAVAAFQQALPGLKGESYRAERHQVLYDMGRAFEDLLRYDAARSAYAAVLDEAGAEAGAAPVSSERLLAIRVALARVSLFDDPVAAREQLDLVLPQAAAVLGEEHDLMGELYSLRGRIELMAGRHDDAYLWFQRALDAAGGLERSLSLSDIRVRGDLALAAQLLGRTDAARRFMAATGAGRLKEADLELGAVMPLPQCAPVTDLQPTDAAVVEFAIGDDGRVSQVRPIYATRTGSVALEFAQAVARWSWDPAAAAKLDRFWRSALRLELRCTRQPERVNIRHTFQPAVAAWFAAQMLPLPMQMAERRPPSPPVDDLRAALARRESAVGTMHLSLFPVLYDLALHPDIGLKEARVYLDRARLIAAALNAPTELRVMLVQADVWLRRDSDWRTSQRHMRNGLSALLTDLSQRGRVDDRGGAWLRVELGAAHQRLYEYAAARAQYRAVLAMPGQVLPPTDPIRQLAVLQLASLEAAMKHFDEAGALLASAGLSPDQCALVDVRPVLAKGSHATVRFPEKAWALGFEGWVKVNYDIDADGRVREPRTVVAYPPFVFSGEAEKDIARFRYQPIVHAGKHVGCSGYEQRVHYRKPG